MKDLGRRFKNKSAFGQIYKIMGVKDCWLYHFFLKEPNLCHNKNVPIKILSLVTGREDVESCKEAVPTLFLEPDAGQMEVFTL